MNAGTSKLLLCAGIAVVLAAASACVVREIRHDDDSPRLASSYGPPGMARAGSQPPELLVETIGLAPDEDMVWVDGYWHWAGMDWMWVDGRWTYPPDGYVYVEPYYDWYGGYCDYVPGYWDSPGELPPGSVVRDHRDSRPRTARVPSRRGGTGSGHHRPAADVVRDHRADSGHDDTGRDNTRVPATYDGDYHRPAADVVRDHRTTPEPIVVSWPAASSVSATDGEPVTGQPVAPTHVMVVYPATDVAPGTPTAPPTYTTYPVRPVDGATAAPPVRTQTTYNPPVQQRTAPARTVTPPRRTTSPPAQNRAVAPPARRTTTTHAPVRQAPPARRSK